MTLVLPPPSLLSLPPFLPPRRRDHLADEACSRSYSRCTTAPSRCPPPPTASTSSALCVVSQLPLPRILPTMREIARPMAERLAEVLKGARGAADAAQILEQLCQLLRDVRPAEKR